MGDTKLALRAEYQHEDIGDLAANEVDQQQVPQCLLGRAELGVGRDLDDERLRVIAPARQAKSSPSGSLVGRTSSAAAACQRTRSVTPPRRRMASPWCSMSHLAILSLSLAGSGMVHRAAESRTVRPARRRRLRHRAGDAPHHTPCRFGPERKVVAGPARYGSRTRDRTDTGRLAPIPTVPPSTAG